MSRRAPRMFFCHIPKTAGGTVKRLLSQVYPFAQMMDFETAPQLVHVTDAELAGARCIAGHAGAALIRRLPEDTVYVTMLRDPVERLRSLHRYFRQSGAIGPDEDFATFVQAREHRMQTDNVQSWMLCHDMDLACRRMYRERKIDDATILALAQQSLRQFHLIGFQEQLGTFVERLAQLTGHTFGAIPGVNATQATAEPEPEPLDDAAAAALEELTALDRLLYTFAQEIAEAQWQWGQQPSSGFSGEPLFKVPVPPDVADAGGFVGRSPEWASTRVRRMCLGPRDAGLVVGAARRELLAAVQVGVEPVADHELVVAADFDDLPGVEDHDAVGDARGRKAVCDDEAGSPRHQPLYGVANHCLALGVEVRRRLVEDQQGRIAEELASDREPLLLATGQTNSPFADNGVETVLESSNEHVCVRVGAGGEDARVIGLGSRVRDVVPHGAVEQEHLLGNDADATSQPVQRVR